MVDTSDILILLGAVVIFAILSLNTNRMLNNHNSAILESELTYTGIAKAQDVIDHARVLAFDETTIGGAEPAVVPDGFTDPADLGSVSDGDSASVYDDFDDFNGMSETDTTAEAIYAVSAEVMYVTSGDPDTDAGTQTKYKKLTVTVSSPYLDNSITMSFIKGYY